MCILFATHSPPSSAFPSPTQAPDSAARLLAGVQYTRMCIGACMFVCVCLRAVVAALPQRYFENCILRFSRGFACFDRVAADFDLMTFQHTHTPEDTHTHVHRARHYQHQRQSNNKHHSLTHSLIHSFTRSRSQRVTPRHMPRRTTSRW